MIKPFVALVLVSLTLTGARADESAKANSQQGKLASGSSLSKSPDVPDSEEYRAFKERLVKAEAGDSKSQYDIGLTYLIGNEKRLGVKKDESLAESWFLKAAKQGNISALSQLRMIHSRRALALKNKGVNDTEEATECLKFRILLGDRSNSFMDMYSDSTKAEAKKRAAKFRSDNGLPGDPDSSRSAPPEAR